MGADGLIVLAEELDISAVKEVNPMQLLAAVVLVIVTLKELLNAHYKVVTKVPLAQAQQLKLLIMMTKITYQAEELVLQVPMTVETALSLLALIPTTNQAQLTMAQFQAQLSSSSVNRRLSLYLMVSTKSESKSGELVEQEELVLMTTGLEDQEVLPKLP